MKKPEEIYRETANHTIMAGTYDTQLDRGYVDYEVGSKGIILDGTFTAAELRFFAEVIDRNQTPETHMTNKESRMLQDAKCDHIYNFLSTMFAELEELDRVSSGELIEALHSKGYKIER